VAISKTAKSGGKGRNSVRSMKSAGTLRRTKAEEASGADAESLIEGEDEITIDRRRQSERRDNEIAAAPTDVADTAGAPKLERRKKVNRRRQIDPTTCERDYTEQEVEFMNALDDYKRKSGRMFPTCSEVLEVIHSLGYVKLSAAEASTLREGIASAQSAKPMTECAATCEPQMVS
jgi:hypothetical protein